MDHAATMRRLYGFINAGDVDGFGELLADDFVEHEETPGLAPTKDGVKEFFRMYLAAFPDLHMEAAEVIGEGSRHLRLVRRLRAVSLSLRDGVPGRRFRPLVKAAQVAEVPHG